MRAPICSAPEPAAALAVAMVALAAPPAGLAAGAGGLPGRMGGRSAGETETAGASFLGALPPSVCDGRLRALNECWGRTDLELPPELAGMRD